MRRRTGKKLDDRVQGSYDNKKSLVKVSLQSLIFTFLYACSDEFHQLFITGRSGEFRDVMIDTIGGFIGSTILYLYHRIKNNYKKEVNRG